jgi:hypothetical protein
MAAPKTPVPVLVIPAALCDEFGELTKLKDEFAPIQSRYNKCRERLAALVADADPEAEFRVEGEKYRVLISARGLEKRVDIPAARKELGAARFLEVVTVTMKALEKFLLKAQIEALTLVERTGPRTYSPVPLRKDGA